MLETYYEPQIELTVRDGDGGIYVSIVVGVERPTQEDLTTAMHEVAARVQAAAEEALRNLKAGQPA